MNHSAIWTLLGCIGLVLLLPFMLQILAVLMPIAAILAVSLTVIKIVLYLLFGRSKADHPSA